MAELYPFSGRTAELLKAGSTPGDTHRWLARVASSLRHRETPESCFAFLRRYCDLFVTHRTIPDREIHGAVAWGFGEHRETNYGNGAIKWPKPDPLQIESILLATKPAFDGVTSTGLRPSKVLPHLFSRGELICTGPDSYTAIVRPLEAVLADTEPMQFIVVNPMRGRQAVNKDGNPSARCQANTGPRRHLVAEFDDPSLTKPMQASLLTALGRLAPLVLAVDSGGKSIHGWFRVDAMAEPHRARFFAAACVLGADPSRWDVCGWLRMPGGLRDGKIRQKILFCQKGSNGRD